MWNLAQATYQVQPVSTGVSVTLILIALFVAVLYIAASWRIFTKAGQAGWKTLIPIYNTIILLRIVGSPAWYVLLFVIPFIGAIFAIMTLHKLSKVFGYGIGMTILQVLLVGSLIIAFGKSRYLGPDGTDNQNTPQTPTSGADSTPTVSPTEPLVQ